tara:strand:- start:862 stop:1332 length:471 start_codon:yes stop_codon:yes gene_type:complete|eukprot:scaffold34305_cov62-Phaeocystis_antarctica.AAC.3
MARRLDAPARRLSPESLSFKDREDWRQAGTPSSDTVLSRVRSTSLGDLKMAPEKAVGVAPEKAVDETPEQLSSELLRELIAGQREQTAKLARIEVRIGALEQPGSAAASDEEDEDVLAEDEMRRERLIKKFASSEVYGSLGQDSFHRHAVEPEPYP